MSIAYLLSRIIQFYQWIIIAYILMSWFRPSGMLFDIYRVLGQLSEPYLRVFRRYVPAAGGIDFSPMIAIIVLQLVGNMVVRALATSGL